MKALVRYILNRYYLLSVPLIYFSFPSIETAAAPFLAISAWISLVPLLSFVNDIPLKKVFIISFVTGFIAFFLAFSWMGSFAKDIPFGNILLITPFMPVISVIFATKIFLAEFLSRRTGYGRALYYASIWVLIDYFQTFGYMAFPWIFWGNTQYAFTPLIQLSSVTGVFGITFLLIFFNAALSQSSLCFNRFPELLRKRENRSVIAAFIVIALTIAWGSLRLYMHPRSLKGGYTVAQIQSCISPWEDWYENRYSYMRDLYLLTSRAIKESPVDLIVLNEATSLETLSYSYKHNSMNSYEYSLFQLVKHLKTPLLTGEIGQYEDGDDFIYTNGAVLINDDGSIQQPYSKIHLAPIGETFPYGVLFPDLMNWLESMGASAFTPGTRPVLLSARGATFGTLVCYESLFPSLNRKYKLLGTDFLVNITNDGWSNYYSGHMQHFSGSPLRAVENGLYYVRCGNTGFTTVVDPYGRIMKSLPLFKKGYMIEHLDFSQNHKTVYSVVGNMFVLFCAVFVLFVSANTEYKLLKKQRTIMFSKQ